MVAAKLLNVMILLVSSWLFEAAGQRCLHSRQGIGTPPPFRNEENSDYLGNIQAIMTTYQFRCCGSIKEWRTYVLPRNARYNFTFQLWRPSESSTGTTMACYTLVGENRFVGNADVTKVFRSPRPETCLNFTHGDVLGMVIAGGSDDNSAGIQFEDRDHRYTRDVLWYRDSNGTDGNGTDGCSDCVSESHVVFPSVTQAAPVLSVSLATWSCPTSSILLPPPQPSPAAFQSSICIPTSHKPDGNTPFSPLQSTQLWTTTSSNDPKQRHSFPIAIVVGVTASVAFLLFLISTGILISVGIKKGTRKAREKRVAVKEAEHCLNQLAIKSKYSSGQGADNQIIEMADNDCYNALDHAVHAENSPGTERYSLEVVTVAEVSGSYCN